MNGQKLRRIVYLYSQETLNAAAVGFKHIKAGFLAPTLIENGWISHIFQRMG